MTDELTHYTNILIDILATLEGGDVQLDFEESPAAAATLRIIANIAADALNIIRANENLLAMFNDVQINDLLKRKEASEE